MKFLIFFVIVGFFVENGLSQICTHAHEVYQSCSNGCQTTCKNYENPPMCIAACLDQYAGCYCEAPYVRSDSGECVLTSQCKTQTCSRLHEKYQSCGNGCQTTCKNYENPPICIAACLEQHAGCYCEAPYVRSDSGECVLTSQCKKQTCSRLHEKYQSCSNGCQTTCKNYKNPPICTQQCSTKLAGCYCEYPYVRSDSGDCVLTSQCKPTCS